MDDNQYRVKNMQNYDKAAKELEALTIQDNNVEDWRENRLKHTHSVGYDHCELRDGKEHVVRRHLSSVNRYFPTVQLKFEGSHVLTSSGSIVPLQDVVYVWNLLIDSVKDIDVKPGYHKMVNFKGKNIKIGTFPLRAFIYGKVRTISGNYLDEYGWCMVVGCNVVWAKDIADFARYYNLPQFDLTCAKVAETMHQ